MVADMTALRLLQRRGMANPHRHSNRPETPHSGDTFLAL